MNKKKLIVILGPTAVGKTDISIEVANELKCEIISCDSRQFYKEISIGTAKPSDEQLSLIKHHFINNISIHDYYNVSMFEFEVLEKLETLFKTSDYAVMVGGSGLYIDAVCEGIDDLPNIDIELRNSLISRLDKEGVESLRLELKNLDPEYYKIVDLRNKNRILRAVEVSLMTGKPYSSFRKKTVKDRDFEIIKIGLNIDREILYDKVNKRVDLMIDAGLIEEAEENIKNRNFNALNTVGYKELFDYFDGNSTKEKAVELIKRNTRHYAKKQISWFNRYTNIKWNKPTELNIILKEITK